MFATLHLCRTGPTKLTRPQRRLLLASATLGMAMAALFAQVDVGAVHAQSVRLTDQSTEPNVARHPIETLAERLRSAHRVALHSARTLMAYAKDNQAALDRGYLSAQANAIGHTLDAARAASVGLATAVRRSKDRQHVQALQRNEEAANDAHEALIDTLAGAAITLQEMSMITGQLTAHVEAAEREVTALCHDKQLSCGAQEPVATRDEVSMLNP